MTHNYSRSKNWSKVAVVGGRGYSGLELCRLLKKHPQVSSITCFGTKAQTLVQDLPYYTVDKIFDQTFDAKSNFQTVFLATPAEVSLDLAPKLLEAGLDVIDLSGAFRLNTQNILKDYAQWYKMEHTHPALVQKAHYGLVPWATPADSSQARLIANPGCYASAILMGILPLLKNDLIQIETLVIDAKSGTTGAGKKAEEGQLFSEVDGECLPYKVGEHQHLPEVIWATQKIGQKNIDPFFSTHLLPTRRGIIAGIYAKLSPGKTAQDVAVSLREFYTHYPLVKFGQGITKDLVSLKKVVGTPNTHINFCVSGEKLYLYSSIDNLLKGAASQAIENFNLLQQLPVSTGLEHLEAIV